MGLVTLMQCDLCKSVETPAEINGENKNRFLKIKGMMCSTSEWSVDTETGLFCSIGCATKHIENWNKNIAEKFCNSPGNTDFKMAIGDHILYMDGDFALPPLFHDSTGKWLQEAEPNPRLSKMRVSKMIQKTRQLIIYHLKHPWFNCDLAWKVWFKTLNGVCVTKDQCDGIHRMYKKNNIGTYGKRKKGTR